MPDFIDVMAPMAFANSAYAAKALATIGAPKEIVVYVTAEDH